MKGFIALAAAAGIACSAAAPVQAAAVRPDNRTDANGAPCKPQTQVVRRRAQTAEAPAAAAPRDTEIKGIPGVVEASGAWMKVFQQGGNSADGLVPDRDGSLLFAQEDYDNIMRLDPQGRLSVAMSDVGGVSSLFIDRRGRLYGVHRTEWVESTKPDKAEIINGISVLQPQEGLIGAVWDDGSPLTIRPNDFAADSRGGGYFTGGCLYYAAGGRVSVMADGLRTNGIAFSLDDRTLFVTNGPSVVAFDVQGPGRIVNQRDFARLEAGGNGDGMTVDSEGRLYVASGPGVQVFDPNGKYLGLIPTPRGVISVAFAGLDKRTLYVVGGGADDEQGKPIRMGPQQTAATIYKLPMLARGIQGRGK